MERATSSLGAFFVVTGGFYFDVVYFFAGLFEVGILVLFFLWLRFLMLHYKRYANVGSSVVGICICGGVPVVMLLLGLILRSIGSSITSMTTVMVFVWLNFLLTSGLVLTAWAFVLFGCIGLRSFLADQRVK